MIEWILSSSALILLLILLRFVLKGKISLRLQYALWGLVLLRLLIPVSFGSTALSVINALPSEARTAEEFLNLERLELQTGTESQEYILTPEQAQFEQDRTGEARIGEPAPVTGLRRQVDFRNVLLTLWFTGMAVTALCLLGSNLHFAGSLRRSRKLLREEELPVYLTEAADTPCLFGLIRPAVYVTTEAAEEEGRLRHVIAHELTHYRHGDQFWSLLRGLCLTLHWYNPLVWWAAVLSRRDAELACDEATIARMGEDERAAYGRTLLYMTCSKRPALLLAATTMSGGKGSIRERITFIARKPKMAIYTLAVVLVLAAAAVGCTFTGATKEAEQAPEPTVKSASVPTDAWLLEAGRSAAEEFAMKQGLSLRPGEGTVLRFAADGKSADTVFPCQGSRYSVSVSFAEGESGAWTMLPDMVLIEKDRGRAKLRLDLGKPIPEAVADYAMDTAQVMLDYYERDCGYVFSDARITGVSQMNTGTAGLTDSINMYLLEYRFLPAEGEEIMLVGGMTMEDGWLTEWGSTGQPYLLMHVDDSAERRVWTRICTTNTDVIMEDFGATEMLEKYGNPFTAAAMELFAKHESSVEEASDDPVILLSFFDMEDHPLSATGGWYDLEETAVIAVSWTGKAPQGIRLLLTPTGTGTYNETRLIAQRSVTREELEHGELRFDLAEPELADLCDFSGHLWVELDYGSVILPGTIYNVYRDRNHTALTPESSAPLEELREAEDITLLIGEQYTIPADLFISMRNHEELIWSSENPEIASVNANGTVVALERGVTVIKVTSGGLSIKYTVRVLG